MPLLYHHVHCLPLLIFLHGAGERGDNLELVKKHGPPKLIEAGVRNSNLRQLVHRRLHELGERCGCIRCREVGLNQGEDQKPDPDSLVIRVEPYDASGGREVFISMEDADSDLMMGFVRLRRPGLHKLEEFGQVALDGGSEGYGIVRELKVFGELVGLKEDKKGAVDESRKWQHQGIGRTLMEEAEGYARKMWGCGTMLVNSGVGARLYYKKMGYSYHSHYMLKEL